MKLQALFSVCLILGASAQWGDQYRYSGMNAMHEDELTECHNDRAECIMDRVLIQQAAETLQQEKSACEQAKDKLLQTQKTLVQQEQTCRADKTKAEQEKQASIQREKACRAELSHRQQTGVDEQKELEADLAECHNDRADCVVERTLLQGSLDASETEKNECLAREQTWLADKTSLEDQRDDAIRREHTCQLDNSKLQQQIQLLQQQQQQKVPCVRTPRTVTITSTGYFQNGGYLPEDGSNLVVSWQSGNTRDVWAIHDDLGPLGYINPAPGGQQKTRVVSVCGRVHCPRAPFVTFNVS
ncbi:hypothetical protein ASPZODRAFT_26711 [Penicilliopsis zonata CBS 506.65]|uniref:Uncharacterized protein n=1 Tax=Penicilliopsis zonata CBS 506.65 TaxID=1073090 RepID=A0A1L9SE38_9EURO|nr:hypothetical protein ASPZODRAFT_26711 [Penicilliopsis zonata CBS 506.65]OJJ45357.1 hypothetical protein ASPZODRAFT_26711 [Penicilliopsis zonata CBS 506.65]